MRLFGWRRLNAVPDRVRDQRDTGQSEEGSISTREDDEGADGEREQQHIPHGIDEADSCVQGSIVRDSSHRRDDEGRRKRGNAKPGDQPIERCREERGPVAPTNEEREGDEAEREEEHVEQIRH